MSHVRVEILYSFWVESTPVKIICGFYFITSIIYTHIHTQLDINYLEINSTF